MKQIFKNQFLMGIIAYVFVIGLATTFLFGHFQNIKLANEKNREQLGVYQNLKIKGSSFLEDSQKVTCDGNLFFQAGAPVTAIHFSQGHLYISQLDNQLVIVDLDGPDHPARFIAPVLTDIYTDATDIYGTDFFNDKVVRLVFKKGQAAAEKFYPKIGKASALTRDSKGYFYVSGYASGNITKIIGRDGFLFLSGLDKIVDLEASSASHLLAARYGVKPALVSIDLNEKKQTVIEQEKSVSSLAFDGDSFWVAYDLVGQSQIGKIKNDGLIDDQVLNCPFPLKIAVSPDRLFYTSLEDSGGKVYWINKNLQKNGK